MRRLRLRREFHLSINAEVESPEAAAAARARNGEYAGPCEVRVIPRGMPGTELRAGRGEPPARGQIWRRGLQRVRILKATEMAITFLELNYGDRKRTLRRVEFLRHSHREVL